MNHVYKVVFNRSLGLWQAVSELARGHSKSGRSGRKLRAPGSRVGNLLVSLSLAAVAAPGLAQTWNGSVDNFWITNGNWNGGTAPNVAGAAVIIDDTDPSIAASKTITLGASYRLGSLSVSSTRAALNTVVLAGGTLNFDNGTGLATLDLVGRRNLSITSAIAMASDLRITNGSTDGGVLTIGALSGGGHILTFNTVAGARINSAGNITNTPTIHKTGSGTLSLTGSNTFAAGSNFYFDAGTLAFNAAAALGNANLTIVMANGGNQVFDISGAAGTVSLNNRFVLADSFNLEGGSAGRSLTLNAGQVTDLTGLLAINVGSTAATTLTFGGTFYLQGAGSLRKAGVGALALISPNNTFSGGLVINQGIVTTGSGSDLAVAQVLAGTEGTLHYVGTGNITLIDPSARLNIVQGGAGIVQIGNADG
ncbi:MAG: ESPR domain-containing protein, partial [Pseudomonadales bacterium]|nr:ESPR domain-containing protein [Pseudomonadales bacterium]